MEAVVRTGGKQYLVKEGDKILIEKTGSDIGAEIKFDDIKFFEESTLLICDSGQKFNLLDNPNEINIFGIEFSVIIWTKTKIFKPTTITISEKYLGSFWIVAHLINESV